MKKLLGSIGEIGDLEHLRGLEDCCTSGAVVLINQEELKKSATGFVFQQVAIVPLKDLKNHYSCHEQVLAQRNRQGVELKHKTLEVERLDQSVEKLGCELKRLQNTYIDHLHDLAAKNSAAAEELRAFRAAEKNKEEETHGKNK